ncbi:hypothetical protein M407DRAFT_242376 [Tulasnella calospora MUT 4182]|uniref:Uncharacterized protein n=1 Tax=Tulasnella calospora MUT 4182 TaxID=1051891 RepID=A0A0C3QF94_9AGAM|nr:hypothetical protein M407DRAFT_242376 [Tulasnella calospora MUT 4182]
MQSLESFDGPAGHKGCWCFRGVTANAAHQRSRPTRFELTGPRLCRLGSKTPRQV